jgi:addiction module HigA family antidote
MTMTRVTTHPGEILEEEFLKPLGMSINALAIALRVPANRIGAIVEGKRAVTADTAMRLGRYFSMSAVFWLNLQTLHDLSKADKELRREVEREVRPRAA